MFFLHPISLNCAALMLVAQLYAVPAAADDVSVGGFIIIGSPPLSLHHRSKHKVHRYYGVPYVYEHQTKPEVYHGRPKPLVYDRPKHRLKYAKLKKRNRNSAQTALRTRSSPYYIPQNYGIQRRSFGYGFPRSRY